jgi:hypothetical protein
MTDRNGSVLSRLLAFMVKGLILIILLNGALKAARLFMLHPAVQAATVTRTAFELQQIAGVIEGEELLTGAYPTDFTQFMRDNFDRKSGGDTTTDPWGNPYRFENKEREFVVYSAGPDGVLHTTDDLYIKRVKPRWRHAGALRM